MPMITKLLLNVFLPEITNQNSLLNGNEAIFDFQIHERVILHQNLFNKSTFALISLIPNGELSIINNLW